jgi:hypothetical protein
MSGKSLDRRVGTWERQTQGVPSSLDGIAARSDEGHARKIDVAPPDDDTQQAKIARHIEAQAMTLMFAVASLGLITGLLLARQ